VAAHVHQLTALLHAWLVRLKVDVGEGVTVADADVEFT
jgi:hypothetical protein